MIVNPENNGYYTVYSTIGESKKKKKIHSCDSKLHCIEIANECIKKDKEKADLTANSKIIRNSINYTIENIDGLIVCKF